MKPSWIPEIWVDKDKGRFQFLHAWPYLPQGQDDTPIGWVARYQNSPDDKAIIPFFRANGKAGVFEAGALPDHRPLFGLHTLTDATALIFITEGEKDATALHHLELCAVSSQGGSRAADKADWRPVKDALERGCTTIIWPDDDAAGQSYAVAVAELVGEACECITTPPAGTPAAKGAGAADWLEATLGGLQDLRWDGLGPLPDDADIGVLHDKLLTAIYTVTGAIPNAWREAYQKPDKPETKSETHWEIPLYVVTERGMIFLRQTPHGPQQEQLSNFNAQIVEEIARDDGMDQEIALTIEGKRAGRNLPVVNLSIEQFLSMSWPMKFWGTGCIVWPGANTKDRLRHAIQTLSHNNAKVPRRTVYTHTGWRKLDAGWAYLSAGTAVDAGGCLDGVEVDIGELGNLYAMPCPSATDQDREAAALASFNSAAVAPAHVSVPLIAAVYLAPMTQALGVDFALWLEGPSRSRKSSLAAIMATHFGTGIERTALTANWTDTPTTIEGKLFTLADNLTVIDDYAPQPSANAQATLDKTVHQVVRNIGNRSSRGRSRADLSVRPERRPRALCISTAEQWPTGESIIARLFGVSIRPGQVNLEMLTEAQQAGRSGLLARCMADYLQDIAGDYEARMQAARDHWSRWRQKAMETNLQGRLPEQVAFLMVGYCNALEHWRKYGLMDQGDVTEYADRAWSVLTELARSHHRRIETAQPAEAFRDALIDLLAVGQVHLLNKNDGERPSHAERYGWKGTFTSGAHIGWVSEEDMMAYLLPIPTLQAVNEALKRSGTPLNMKPTALWRQLQDRGFLEEGNCEDRDGVTVNRNTKKTRIGNHVRNVLRFRLYDLVGSIDPDSE